MRELSRGLTGGRALAGERYLGDPELLGAYLLHFWPISYAQARLCLAMMARDPSAPRIVRALDAGSGPGPVALALLDAGADRVVACDRSAAALAMARSIATGSGYTLETRTWDALGGAVPSGPFDLIALGHTLNELWAGHPQRIELRVSLLLKLAAELAPQGRLLIMEPALMATAQEAIGVRDGLVREGFEVLMPCIWQGACPALPSSTCHGEFAWDPPRESTRLMHAARIGRETLKMAWFVMRSQGQAAVIRPEPPADAVPDGGLYRVVSEPLLSKSGRIRRLVCGPLGRFALSAPKAGASAGLKAFYRLVRGDAVRFSGAEKRESGWGLSESSTLEVVERPPRIGERQGPRDQGPPRIGGRHDPHGQNPSRTEGPRTSSAAPPSAARPSAPPPRRAAPAKPRSSRRSGRAGGREG